MINVNGSFVHKLIAFLILLMIETLSMYGVYVNEVGTGFYVISIITCIILSLLFACMFIMYLFFATFRSDRYTLQEWIERL